MMRTLMLTLVLTCLLVPMNVFAQKVGGGNLTYTPKNASPVIFNHEKHVNEKGIKCSGCHYQLFQMAQGSYKMEMKMLTKGDFCGKCHNGQKGFDVKDRSNCIRCHQ
jgi:c(7)-type cytochrome triheme protein